MTETKKPDEIGYYYCHVNPEALMKFKPTLFWDGQNWCSGQYGQRTIQAVQNRYWQKLDGGLIYKT
jgi:hypothetical protein